MQANGLDIKVIRYITHDLEDSSDDSDEEQIKAKYQNIF